MILVSEGTPKKAPRMNVYTLSLEIVVQSFPPQTSKPIHSLTPGFDKHPIPTS
jgi:hypothetical protein